MKKSYLQTMRKSQFEPSIFSYQILGIFHTFARETMIFS